MARYVSDGALVPGIQHEGLAVHPLADGCAADEHNSESFAGLHMANGSPWYLFDEASGIPDKIWEVAKGGITDGQPFWFTFGNGTKATGYFHKIHHNSYLGKLWSCKNIDSREVEGTNKQYLAELEEELGAESDEFRVRVRGLFPIVSQNQMFPSNIVLDSCRSNPEPQYEAPIIQFWDMAEGGDRTVGAELQGMEIRDLGSHETGDQETMRNAIMGAYNNSVPDVIGFDKGGMGPIIWWFRDTLRIEAIPVMFGSAPLGKTRNNPLNRRAEGYYRLLQWMRDGGRFYPELKEDSPQHEELRADLLAQKVSPEGKASKMKMLDKKQVKRELGRSPDRSDACAGLFMMHHPPKRNRSNSKDPWHGKSVRPAEGGVLVDVDRLEELQRLTEEIRNPQPERGSWRRRG